MKDDNIVKSVNYGENKGKLYFTNYTGKDDFSTTNQSKIAVALAGFSHADADGLRKTMSKKDKRRQLQDYRARFISGARARGLSHEQINAVWEMIRRTFRDGVPKPAPGNQRQVHNIAVYQAKKFDLLK